LHKSNASFKIIAHSRTHTQKKLGLLIGNITIFGYWRYTITIRLIQTIPLQLCDTRTNAMGYAQRRLRATCMCVHCITISVWMSMPSGQLDKAHQAPALPFLLAVLCSSSSSCSVCLLPSRPLGLGAAATGSTAAAAVCPWPPRLPARHSRGGLSLSWTAPSAWCPSSSARVRTTTSTTGAQIGVVNGGLRMHMSSICAIILPICWRVLLFLGTIQLVLFKLSSSLLLLLLEGSRWWHLI